MIKSIDGPGSGIDADTVDGYSGASLNTAWGSVITPIYSMSKGYTVTGRIWSMHIGNIDMCIHDISVSSSSSAVTHTFEYSYTGGSYPINFISYSVIDKQNNIGNLTSFVGVGGTATVQPRFRVTTGTGSQSGSTISGSFKIITLTAL